MTRALRALLGALGVAIVALIAWLTPPVGGVTRALLGLLSAVLLWYVWRWPQLEQRLAEDGEAARAGPAGPGPFDLGLGFVTNFFDTLGIGNFAPTTAAIKLTRRMPDEDIPGTLNVGHAVPVLPERASGREMMAVAARSPEAGD